MKRLQLALLLFLTVLPGFTLNQQLKIPVIPFDKKQNKFYSWFIIDANVLKTIGNVLIDLSKKLLFQLILITK